jgi:transposase
MGNVLSDEKKQQVLALGRLGWPLRRIEEATGVRRETSSLYLRAAGIAVRAPRKWGHGAPANPAKEASTDPAAAKPAKEPSTDPAAAANPANETSTDSGALPAPAPWPRGPTRSSQASACEPYRELVVDALARGRNAMAIYQDLVTDHGFTAGYASVKRFVVSVRGKRSLEAKVVISTAAGEEAQVDYGDGPMVREPTTGKFRRTRLFVMTLGYSRKAVRLLTWRSSARTWSELHERSFRALGGVPRVVVLDNLKEGVLTPDVYDPAVNPLYRDVLAHYGVVALPCRVRHPDRKGKVESSIGHTQRTPLKGMRFETLEEAQAFLDRWDARWADTRIHGTTKRQVATMFDEERPHLSPLPVEPFRYYHFGNRTVHLDGHVEIDGAYYSAPPGNIGRRLLVQWDERTVRLLDPRTSELLREHRPMPRGRHGTHDDDRPKQTPSSTLVVLSSARRAGRNIGKVADAIHARDGELGVKRILGLLSLAKKRGSATVDAACAFALDAGVPTYRFVRRYLERQPTPPLRQIDPLIRDLTHYRDLIARMTKEPA